MKKLTLTLFFLCFSLTGAFPTVTTINSKIDSLMKLVDIDTLEYYIRYLQDLGPRPRKTTHPDYPNNVAAKKWLYQQYKNIGNLDVYFHHFLSAEQCDTFWNYDSSRYFVLDSAMNVVAVQKGTEYSNEYIIVCSHFDTGYGSPGANNNASGTSGVVEIARILSKLNFKRSIVYLNNNGEESNIWGSVIFARYCRDNDINIPGVFNLDMIGYNPINIPQKIFYNDSPPINKEFAKYFNEVSNLYLSIIPACPQGKDQIDGIGDDRSFIFFNYPAMYIGLLETSYINSVDTIGIGKENVGVNSMELVKRYTQVTLAAIAELAELSETSIDFKEPLNYTITHNPDNNEIILKLYFSEIGNLIVTLNNILGQQVQELYNGFYDKSLIDILFSIGNLPIGTYYLKIKYNDSIKVEKIIRN